MSDDEMTPEQRSFEQLKISIEHSIRAHRVKPDAWFYNGGTVLILCLTAATSFIIGIGGLGKGLEWIPSLLSVIAGVLVALERSLGFGPRWRFHTEMKAGYTNVKDMLQFYFVIPEEDSELKKKFRNEIWQSLNALRNRESAIPNSGGALNG